MHQTEGGRAKAKNLTSSYCPLDAEDAFLTAATMATSILFFLGKKLMGNIGMVFQLISAFLHHSLAPRSS